MKQTQIFREAILEIANRYRLPLWPVSKGKNWGYGGASPTKVLSSAPEFLNFCQTLKSAIDPNGVMAPGKYGIK